MKLTKALIPRRGYGAYESMYKFDKESTRDTPANSKDSSKRTQVSQHAYLVHLGNISVDHERLRCVASTVHLLQAQVRSQIGELMLHDVKICDCGENRRRVGDSYNTM